METLTGVKSQYNLNNNKLLVSEVTKSKKAFIIDKSLYEFYLQRNFGNGYKFYHSKIGNF